MSHFVRFATFACISFACLLGTVVAQDVDAIKKRLKKAVKKGEINEDQADVMLEAFMNTLPKKEAQADKDRQKHVETIGAGLKSAVALGLMSEEEAMRAFEEIKQGKRDVFREEEVEIEIDHDAAERELRAARERLIRLAEEGEISKEEAEERFESLVEAFHRDRERAQHRERDAESELIEAREQLRRAIAAGKLSEEDAERKFAELERELERRQDERREIEQDRRNRVREREATEERFHEAGKAIQRALERGDLTEEEASKKWEEIKRELQERDRR